MSAYDDGPELYDGPPDDDEAELTTSPGDDRTMHVYDPSEPSKAIDALLAAIGRNTRVFKRSNELVMIVHSIDDETKIATASPYFRALTAANLRDFASGFFCLCKPAKDGGMIPIKLPDEIVQGALDRGRYPSVRDVEAIVEAPMFRPDGTLIEAPGYDAQTKLVYVPSGAFLPVESKPTRDDARASLAALRDLFVDFPFVDEAHFSAYCAALLTPACRQAVNGCVPLTMIEASTPGSGKSMLTDAINVIYAGRTISKSPYSEDPEEQRKNILSLAVDGRQIIAFDNIKKYFGDPALDLVLTTRYIDDRLLGTNKRIRARNDMQFLATSNNPLYRGDITRRMLLVRLQGEHENPELRTGFKHADLIGHITAQRFALYRHVCTIIRAYFAADKPDMSAKPWGAFEAWSKLLCNLLMWLGLPNPMDTRALIAAGVDPGKDAIATVMQGIEKFDRYGQGLTVSQLVREMFPDPPNGHEPDYYEAMREALIELAPPKRAKQSVDAQRLGMMIQNTRGRIMGGLRFVDAGMHHGSKKWKVERVTKAPTPTPQPDPNDIEREAIQAADCDY